VVNVVALLEAMDSLGLESSVQETVADLFGLQDSVTLAELRAAIGTDALSGRDLIRLRRALGPQDDSVRRMSLFASIGGDGSFAYLLSLRDYFIHLKRERTKR
jgi:hypothetical protein